MCQIYRSCSLGLSSPGVSISGFFVVFMQNKNLIGQKKRVWLYLTVALGVSAIACAVVSILTVDSKTFKAVSSINTFYFGIVAVVVVGRWLCECLRFRMITRAMGKDIPFGRLSKAVLGSAFTGAITPYRAGGFPAQVFFLSRYGLTGGEATAVSTAGGVVSLLVMALSFSVVVFLGAASFRIHVGARTALVLAGLVSVVVMILTLSLIKKPLKVVKLINAVIPGFLKKKECFIRFEKGLANNICDFTESMRTFVRGRKHHLISVFLLTMVFWFSGALAVSLILRGLGYPQYFWKAMMGQIVVSSILPFAPVPGASGIAEAAFAGIFSVFINKSTAGILTVIWRFFTMYFPMLLLAVAFFLALKDSKVGRKAVVNGCD